MVNKIKYAVILLMSDQLANSATPVTVRIDVDNTNSPEKSMPHASKSSAMDNVATSTLATNSPLMALLDFNFDFSILASSFGNNFWEVAK